MRLLKAGKQVLALDLKQLIRTSMEETRRITALLVFVVGLPASGKSLQCERLAALPGFHAFSIKDLLVAEVQTRSEAGLIIQDDLAQSRLVAKELIIPLLWRHLATLSARVVLIEGFPRDVEQAVYLEQAGVPIHFLLYYECSEDRLLLQRLVNSGIWDYGQALARIQLHKSTLHPVLELYSQFGVVHRVDARQTPAQIHQNTLELLKPCVICVTGPVFSGKTAVSTHLSRKFGFFRLSMPSLLPLSPQLHPDEPTVLRLVRKLSALSQESCVIIDGFPENVKQARLFEALFGRPEAVIALNYKKDEALERVLKAKLADLKPAVVTKRFEAYEGKGIGTFYASIGRYCVIPTGNSSLSQVNTRAEAFLGPEIVLLRGELNPQFLHFLSTEQHFTLLNAANLMRLWRQARALSVSEKDQDLSDDEELIPLLKRTIYGRRRILRLALYNFALGSKEIVEKFEKEVAVVKCSFYLYSESIGKADPASLYLYSTQRLHFLCVGLAPSDLDLPLYRKGYSEYADPKKARVVFVYGAKASGKTRVVNMLVRDFGYQIANWNSILPIDEEENFTFPQFCDSFRSFLLSKPEKKLVFEGNPPFPASTAPNRVGAELLDLAARWETLLNSYLPEFCVAAVRTEAEVEDCCKRSSVSREEVMNSALQAYYLSQSHLLPGISYTVATTTPAAAVAGFRAIFDLKLVLVQSQIDLKEAVAGLCFQCGFSFIDCASFLLSGTSPIDSIRDYCNGTTLSSTVFLYNFPFSSPNTALPGQLFADFQALEQLFGRLQALLQVGELETLQALAHESLPVRRRRNMSKDPSTATIDGESSTNVSFLPSPETVPMWNQHECANLTLGFQFYKGEKATFERISLEDSDLNGGIEEIIQRIRKSEYPERLNIQVITPFSPISAQFPSNTAILEYFEPLPLDISTLGRFSQRLAAAFTNPRARTFHTQRLCSFTVPFNCFFDNFKPFLQEAGMTISIGLRRAIQSYVDIAGTASITPEDVDRFFNLWENQQIQHEIVTLAQQLDREAKNTGDTIGYKLFLVVIQAEPDPLTAVQSFQKGTVFVLTHEGCPQSARFAADRVTYAGREEPLHTNDIVFREAETRIRSHHFSILSRRTGFFLVDGGSPEGVRLLIEDFPVVLFTNAVLYFGQSKCVVCSTVARPAAPLSEFIHILDYSQTEESLPTFTPELELAFLSGPLFGRTFRLSPETKEVYTLGSSPEADIMLRGLGSPVHAWILHGDYGWAVVDMQSLDGTWIAVNMHDRETAGRPSPPLRIRNGMVMEVPGTRFKCVFKSDITFKVQISDFVEVRNIDFRNVYEVGGKVGAGAYGQVFKCKHRGTGCLYAVKIISKARVDDSTLFEIVALKRLDHPNIVRVLDIVDDGRSLYIVTELLTGGELFSKIVEKGHLSEAKAAEVMQQLMAAVSFIHSRSVLHRDIKPENLMYESPLEGSALKLIDFGAARVLLPTYKTAERIGTPYYMAPEVIQGKYDSKCDVWSCGVVLYILLSGRPPFPGKSEYEIFAHIQAGLPSFAESTWKHVSKAAKSLLKDMLKPDPKDRPTAYEVLHHPWVILKAQNVDYTKPLAEKAFACLKSFNASNKLQQAILIFIANNLLTAEERNYAMQLFRATDKDGSGLISREELQEGFKKANFEISAEKMEEIMTELDANMSGMIDYSEFLTGVTAMENLLSRDRINLMFSMFDADGSGDISASELKALLGQSEARWTALIDQVDNNKDGKIDIFEFKSLMLSYIS